MIRLGQIFCRKWELKRRPSTAGKPPIVWRYFDVWLRTFLGLHFETTGHII